MTIKETAEKWNLSVRRVQTICNEGMIDGAMKFGNTCDIVNIGLHFILKNVRPYAAPCSEA